MFDKAKIVYVMLVRTKCVKCCKVFFYFPGLHKPWKYFHNKNFLAAVLSHEHKSVVKDEFAKFKGAEKKHGISTLNITLQ